MFWIINLKYVSYDFCIHLVQPKITCDSMNKVSKFSKERIFIWYY